MLCSVYKSSKKADTYLYIAKRDDFSPVPSLLMEKFGRPIFVMIVPLQKRDLAVAENEKVIAKIKQQGFYLQIPPPVEDLLKSFKHENNQSNNQDKNES
ncbi:MAG: YcgL domain-containing protein [Gammaproteobacteria bacterium]|nr:YcgL domain-containing protein [Gammaproteobacteria bacterium]